MIKNFYLRPIEFSDASAVQQGLWCDISPMDAEVRLRMLAEQSGRKRAWGIVAEADGEIIGFGQLSRWGWRGEICNLIVREGWRSQGIGAALIHCLIDIARTHYLHDVEIGGALSNPRALALYRRLGFQEERRLCLELDGRPEPVVYLVMPLREEIDV
jgi:ribosomal protein S18 acetylase RimI-like enzyme